MTGSARDSDLRWIPAADNRFTMRGLAWYEENGRNASRLLMRARKVVRGPVWKMGLDRSLA